ncbi:DUF2079 domain-containing protein [Candidatus Woesebacteria bacterium]|nr:DUF2079 domain-containing protein [Candidatus Woesebacteria bacterium]
MTSYFRKHLPFIILLTATAAFILYFSLFTIIRYQKLYSHYFDLGIMHQTVYNTYMGLKTGDLSRILEMTDPHASLEQVKRMAVHNDIFLAVLAPFYFIYAGPEMLLVIQVTVVAFGAYFILLIGEEIFRKKKHGEWIAVAFALSYLLYPPLQKAVNFDFHAVTLAPTFLLGMWYAGMKKNYLLAIVWACLTLMTKEQVGLVIAAYGVYLIWNEIPKAQRSKMRLIKAIIRIPRPVLICASTLVLAGVSWVLISMLFIIPHFRGSEHFGAEYYSYLAADPLRFFSTVFRYESLHYVFILLVPAGLLAVFSPIILLIASPEFAMNILSSNGNMRNIYFHYDTVLTAFVFIASMYGGRNVLGSRVFEVRFIKKVLSQLHLSRESVLIAYILLLATVFSIYLSPLPWGHHRETFLWKNREAKVEDVMLWQKYLEDDQIKVSASGHLAPHFTSRQYFYDFAGGYARAEFVIIDTWDISRGFQAEESIAEYEALKNDWKYIRIYEQHGIEVFKRLEIRD